MSKGGTEPRVGPVPFSTEWIEDPPTPQRPRRVPIGRSVSLVSLPDWLPSERLLSAFLVLVIILGTAAFANRSPAQRELNAANVTTTEPATGSIVEIASDASSPSELAVVAPGDAAAGATGTDADPAANGAAPQDNSVVGPGANDAAAAGSDVAATGDEAAVPDSLPADQDADSNLLPANRIVAFYGQPHDGALGILGTTTIEDVYGQLMDKVAEWEAADPSRPVIPAFEIITSVAQGVETNDGSYLLDTDDETIQEYIDFAADHDMLVFLDTQIGRRTIPDEIERLRPLLEQPNVHLALDPEFAMDEGEVPSIDLGEIDASDINDAQQAMADLSAELGIPQKIVLVHQFHYTMIEHKENVQDVPGVELVIHADGHGDPDSKRVTYEVMVTEWIDRITFFAGFKIFMDNNQVNDEPEMSAEDMLALDPPPDIVTYQ